MWPRNSSVYSFRCLLLVGEVEAVGLVPVAAGEVGHLDRHVAVEHGDCPELADAGPLGCVIDIHVEGQAVAQAVDEAVVHYEVHAAVAADLLGDLAHFLVNRVHIFLHEGLVCCIRYEAVGTEVLVVGHLVRADVLRLECEALDGVLVGEALGTEYISRAFSATIPHNR